MRTKKGMKKKREASLWHMIIVINLFILISGITDKRRLSKIRKLWLGQAHIYTCLLSI